MVSGVTGTMHAMRGLMQDFPLTIDAMFRHVEQHYGDGTIATAGPGGVTRVTYAEWADRALLPTAIEELMRFDSPLQLFERTATEDVEIGGITVEKGQKIAALLGSANHDPAVFDRPEELDLGRTENPHISFGAGVHFCIGAPLARVELQATFGALLDRTSSLELGGEPVRRPEFVIRGLAELPVVLT